MNIQPIIDAIAHVIKDNPVGFAWVCVLALVLGCVTIWIIIPDKSKP